MLKIAFALQVIVAAAIGIGSTSSTSTESKSADPVVARVSCSVCSENYDSCVSDGIAPSTCQRLEQRCLANCLP